MNGAAILVLLISALILTAGAATVFFDVARGTEQDTTKPPGATVQVVNVIGQNITGQSIKHVRISVQTDGVVRVNDTAITLRTEDDSAVLQYRDGTLTRDTGTGFYTQ